MEAYSTQELSRHYTSHSCQAEHRGHINARIAVSIHPSFQHKQTHGFGKTTQDLGKGKWPNARKAQAIELKREWLQQGFHPSGLPQ